ncbi:MAG: MBL fold metallo-hydrolase [Beijerinckiaceae bacterium]|nr:MBL fold metallo-hydrolase [Beijerinckiaceae bacterium]
MTSSLRTYRVGDATITAIHEMSIEGFDAGALFPTLDLQVLSDPAAGIAPDQQVRQGGDIVLPVTVWLVRTLRHVILIDTGVGNGKKRGHAAFNHLSTPFLQDLAEAGVRPSDVDMVLLTHIHVDHVGWNTQLIDNEWQCTFPNATYHCSELELETCAGDREIFVDSIEPVISSGRMRKVAAAGEEIVDGIRFEPTPGHTKGHMSIVLTSSNATAYFGGDLAHHPIQVYDPSVSSKFCIEPDEAERSRHRVFARLADTDTLYFSSHFSGELVGRIVTAHGRYRWEPLKQQTMR